MRASILFMAIAWTVAAQVPNPTQQTPVQPPQAQSQQSGVPVFQATVVARTTKAINYHHRTGTTHINFQGTALMPAARGEAAVESRMGSTKIDTSLAHMSPANQFGPEYMTYVLWGITPEGRPVNLGEVALEGDHAKLLSTTDLQAFGLIVTAEPYFSVTQPSDVVVAENIVRNDTAGTIEEVDAKYELLRRGEYVLDKARYRPVKVDPKGPLQIAEAENAVEIATLAGADRYAADTMQRARQNLQTAQDYLFGKLKDRKEAETNAREAAQTAEDARIITYRKLADEERAATEARAQAAQQRAEQANAQAQQDQQRRAAAEAARSEAEQARMQAEAATRQAQLASAQAEQDKAAADAARAAALQQQQAAQAEADQARMAAQTAENEKAALRERLRQQLNVILETRETARGLIVNISDVLFDFNKYTLKPGARETMAKVSGILLAYPGLKIQLEGYTDSVGSDDYNQKLSEQRAESVRDYLIGQGVPGDTVSAVGFGKTNPVATNDTAEGRQRNRRVDMVVSGEPIGIGTSSPDGSVPHR